MFMYTCMGKYLPEVRHLFPAIFGINVADFDVIWCADVKYDVHLGCKYHIKHTYIMYTYVYKNI